MIFHDQSNDIQAQIQRLREKLVSLGVDADHCIHTGPIIRREEEYQYLSIQERRRFLNAIVSFSKALDISYTSFCVEKKQVRDSVELTIALSRRLSRFIQSNLAFFQSFDRVVVYYDNGQTELNRILAAVFSTILFDVEFKKVIPANYRLFQVADMCCTFELLREKISLNTLTPAEIMFFGSLRDLNKNYLRPISKLQFEV